MKETDQNVVESKLNPFNELYREYALCRDNKEDCDEKHKFSEISKTYNETRVEDLPFLRKIEMFENIKKPKRKELDFEYFVDKDEMTNKDTQKEQPLTEISNKYTRMLLTVLATTTIYYFFFKLSK